jgi:hypothetical protein
MVRLPSGARYWTVLDEDLAVVPVADGFLRQVRFGRDGAESTTKSYAGAIALFLRWCVRTGRDWQAGAAQLGLFMTWLAHAGPGVSGIDARPGAAVLAGPGSAPVRSARRVNGVAIPWKCGHFPLVDSCNFGPFSDYRTPVHFY